MHSDHSGRVRRLANRNYGGNGGRALIVAARAAAQTICKCGYRGQTYERMREWLYSSKSRFAGCHSDSSEPLRLIGGCAL